jgi:hypothetical protein
MVMPFDEKETGRTERGVPAKVDFDELWRRVYKPVLADLGYEAVRADQDVGALIIGEMIQRLVIADLVVADITLANANVYYEVGVRHAARQYGCVLVAADWARPVFDLGQIRQLRFPLADGAIGEDVASAARETLTASLEPLTHGRSPVFDAVPGHPGDPRLDRAPAFRTAVDQLSAFETDVRKVRLALPEERQDLVRALLARHGDRRVVREAVVLELIRLVEDHLGWEEALAYIARLPEHLAAHPRVLERRALAMSKSRDAAGAAAMLQTLIDVHGETPERLGMLGGRFKVLCKAATGPAKRGYLRAAIRSYERGMTLDLNGYYASSNLARLYRQRDDPGDEQRAVEAGIATALACRAALARGTADEWVRPTLLANAFDRGDVAEARRLRPEIEDDGPAVWKLESTIEDLRAGLGAHGVEVRAGLAEVLAELEVLLA